MVPEGLEPMILVFEQYSTVSASDWVAIIITQFLQI